MYKRTSAFFLIYVCCIFNCQAQCPTPLQFGTTWVQGQIGITGSQVGTQCLGRVVSMTTPNNVTNIKYIYDYKTPSDTSKSVFDNTFTYSKAGSFYIVQLGIVGGRPSLDCALISVFDTPKPTFEIVNSCETNSVSINITRNAIYGKYVIDWGDGSPLQTITNPQQVIYKYRDLGMYQIRIKGEGVANLTGCSATSDPLPFVVSPAPAAVTTATATVVGGQFGQVNIKLLAGSNAKNFVFTQIGGREIIQQTSVFTDSLAGAAQASVCYQVSYRNACNQSPATKPTVCTIYLADSSGVLRWSAASPFVGRVTEYIVEALDANGQVVQQFKVGRKLQWDTEANEGSVATYRVHAVGADGGVSVSNAVAALQRGAALFVPSAFSPNGDQLNDVLELKGRRIAKGEITIYDRWGSVVFFTSDWRNGWDGNDAKGQPLAVGVFTYKVNYEDTKNQAHQKLGTVQLVR